MPNETAMTIYVKQPMNGEAQAVKCLSTYRFSKKGLFSFLFTLFLIVLQLLQVNSLSAQTDSLPLSSSKLKNLSLEDLMNIEVTSVSMHTEKLTEVASAVQVITGNDIEHSGATRLPEALRLASNIQMAQVNSHDWAITTRGFSGLPSSGGILANKLLVMIDGRSVYSPLFGGVFWDVQNTLMEDVSKIEVVSGPGGTLWGANAVNGVINIVTKSAKETQGLYASGAAGSLLNDFAAVRVGAQSKLDTNLYYRIYAQHFDQNGTLLQSGTNGKDAWDMIQGGFRMDYYPTKANTLTLQGDFYGGNTNRDSALTHAETNGQNVLARFTHVFSDHSDLKIQAYYDRTWRDTPYSTVPFIYSVNTYDLDIQHRFGLGEKQSILYGIAYRFQEDKVSASLIPLSRDMPLYSAFLQDEISLKPQNLRLTLGSKFLDDVFTGFEYQPCARLGWTPDKSNTIWTSVSRAVRTPSRFDADIAIPTNIQFQSEKVMAYELGYRANTTRRISLSISTFFNHYNDLRSLDESTYLTPHVIIANDQRAESWGAEFNANYQVTNWWHLRGGYTYFNRNIWAVNPTVFPQSAAFESVDPSNIFMIQSMMDLGKHLSFDAIGRYVDMLKATAATTATPSYYTCDLRLTLHLKPIDLSLVGQNLLDPDHIEVGQYKIPPSFYVKLACRL
jgi:iron complex outermembrane receptor protein